MTDTDPFAPTGDTTAALEFGPEEAELYYVASSGMPEQITEMLNRWPAGPSLPSDVAIDPWGPGVDIEAVWDPGSRTVSFTLAGREEVSSISLEDFEQTFRRAWEDQAASIHAAPPVVDRLRDIVESADLEYAIEDMDSLFPGRGRYAWDPERSTALRDLELHHPGFRLGEGTGTLVGWVSATAGEDQVRVHLEGDHHPDGVPMPAIHAADLLSRAYYLQTGMYHEDHPTAAVPDRPLTDLYVELTARAEQVAGEVLPEALREGMDLAIDYEQGTAWMRPAFMRNSTTPVAVGVTTEGAVLMVEDHHEAGPGEVIDPGPLTLAERAQRAQPVSAGEARWAVDSALLRNSIDPVASAYASAMGPQATQEAAWSIDQRRGLERRLRAQAILADASARIEAFDVVDHSGRPAHMIDIRGGGLDTRVITDDPGQVRVATPDGGVENMPTGQFIEFAGRAWPDTTTEILTPPRVRTGLADEAVDLAAEPETRTEVFDPDRIRGIASMAMSAGPAPTAQAASSGTDGVAPRQGRAPQRGPERQRGVSL